MREFPNTLLRLSIGLTFLSSLFSGAAHAQRATDNAVTSAGDAFGTVVGNQTIGLYSQSNARGFSPTQAENLRIEGLYYDQQTNESDSYLFSRSDIRIGIAAQSYEFPSPTGIADLTLRVPGDTPLVSGVLIHGPLNLESVEIDGQYPLRRSLSLGLTAAVSRGFDYDYAVWSNLRAASLILHVKPAAGAEFIPFVGYVHNTERVEVPLVYLDGIHPPAFFDEQHLPTQSWTTWRWNELTAGVIGRIAIAEGWSLRAGLFHSKYELYRGDSDLLLGPAADGTADHVLDVTPGHVSASYSGDLRLTRTQASGDHQRETTIALRGRSVRRGFGGDAVVSLGRISLYQNMALPQPPLAFSPDSGLDRVQQTGFGVNDIESWKNRASLSAGLLATHYTREVTTAGAPASSQRTTKMLPTLSAAIRPLKRVTVYGSYTKGLEDSPIAPNYALNRGEPLPAAPTWQADGGARVLLRKDLQLLVGAFQIHKTYFGSDTAGNYTAIGTIAARGIESSTTWTGLEGLTMIAGAVWLRPQVTRRVSEPGATGNVPIGPVPGTIDVNADYAPEDWRGWGMSLQWKWLSSRVVTSDDHYRLPALNTLNLGVRYTAKWMAHPYSVRLDIGNVTNTRGLSLGADYFVLPNLPRNYTLTLATDL